MSELHHPPILVVFDWASQGWLVQRGEKVLSRWPTRVEAERERGRIIRGEP